MTIVISIILAAIGSSGLFALIQYLVERKDKKKNKLDEILNLTRSNTCHLKENKIDNMKTQLLLLMSNYPEETSEIFELAHTYFCTYNGNSFVRPAFEKWCSKQGLKIPCWYPKK